MITIQSSGIQGIFGHPVYIFFIYLFLNSVRRSSFVFAAQRLGNGFCFRLQVEGVRREFDCVVSQDTWNSANGAVPQDTSALKHSFAP
jgi:hypothetical protein